MRPNDPNYSSQWHFNLIGDIETVWNDYTGSGVQVGVYDDGVQATHEDLADNYDDTLHFPGVGSTGEGADDGQPRANDDDHGTACAGIIGADNNGHGGVGVAFDVQLTGVNFLTNLQGEPSYVVNAAFEHMQQFDVVSNSWGFNPTYNFNLNVGNPFSQVGRTQGILEDVVANGRGGLGTILVKAAGNENNNSFLEIQFGIQGNAQGDGQNNMAEMITVAATDREGDATDYSNWGVNLLVTAPAASFSTDRMGAPGYSSGDYTTTFGGTSAATPVVSGVVALMLQANHNLGWRDVQNILAISASHTGSDYGRNSSGYEEGEWFRTEGSHWNGGGMSYNISYGYGMVDAYAAVRMAQAWGVIYGGADNAQTSANQLEVEAQTQGPAQAIPDGSSTGASMSVEITENINIEHIYVDIDITHSFMADLQIELVGPNGEVYELFRNEMSSTDYNNSGYTFGVAAARGTLSAGTWTVVVRDTDNIISGTLNAFEIQFQGSAVNNHDVYHYTSDFMHYNASGPRQVLNDTNNGVDWINMSAIADNVFVDLRNDTGTIRVDGSTWSDVRGANIENVALGDGNDEVQGNHLNNTIHGFRGNDILRGNNGNDRLFGASGDDRLFGGDGNDRLFGGLGNDMFFGGRGADIIHAGNGNDTVDAGFGTDVVHLNAGNDLFTDNGQNDNFGADKVFGGNGNDRIFANGGADELHGQNGNDNIGAGIGADLVFGGNGNDRIFGGAGNDRLHGGNGADTINAGDGHDRVWGNNGNDVVYLGTGFDTFYDNGQNDSYGADRVYGQAGNDTLYGGGGADYLNGGRGNDLINGGINNDELIGEGGNDTLNGGDGNDRMVGGEGDDVLSGGAGSDTFIFGNTHGNDTFTDFNLQEDELFLTGALRVELLADADAFMNTYASVINGGNDAFLDFGDDGSITLTGIDDLAALQGVLLDSAT